MCDKAVIHWKTVQHFSADFCGGSGDLESGAGALGKDLKIKRTEYKCHGPCEFYCASASFFASSSCA